jgi:hypothetical protein
MGHSDLVIPIFHAQFGEPAVTQFPCSHFDAYAMLLCKSLGIKRPYMASDAMFIGPSAHKRLIPVAFCASEIEVAMCHSK